LILAGKTAEGMDQLRAALLANPDRVDALNSLAWTLATHPNPLFRNGEEAVRCALRAVELTHEQGAIELDTLAAAEARLGHFERAIELSKRAVELAARNQPQLSSQIQARMQ